MNARDLPHEGQLLLCEHCGAPYDPDDGFCRRCGAPLLGSQVPAVRGNYQPVVYRRPAVPIVVQGAAAIAAGTVAEIILRRLVKRVFRPRSLFPSLRRNAKKSTQVGKYRDDGEEPDAQIESETIVLRQIRLRRGRRSR